MAIGWPKNRDELIERIEGVADEIPKSWFKAAFEGLPRRWKEVIKRHGAKTDCWIPKND